jgi:hypothetical protein
MRDKRLWLGIPVLLLLFGMAVSEYNTQTDTRLNGTWKAEDGILEKYNSGNYEHSKEDGTPFFQGTYTTSNGKITYTPKYFFIKEYDHSPRWISKDEVEKEYSDIFEIYTREYVINNNNLTYIFDIDDKYILTLVSRDRKFTKAKSIGKKYIYSGEVIYELSKIGRELILHQNFERVIKERIIKRDLEKVDSIENVWIQIGWQAMEIFSSEKNPINVYVIIKFKPETTMIKGRLSVYEIEKILQNSIDGLHPENIITVDQFGNIINNREEIKW